MQEMTAARDTPQSLVQVRRAVAAGDYAQLYAMVPAMDGGQSYEMTCKVCGGYGNVMGGPFIHEAGCPVEIEERKQQARNRNWFFRALRALRRLYLGGHSRR